MKVLCEYADCGPSYVRSGWGKVLAALGHEFVFWRPQVKPAFDIFREYEPDLFIGTTYGFNRALFKCIRQRPRTRVILYASAWGDLVNNLDREKYPIVIVSDEEKRTIELLKKQTGKPDFVFIHVTNKYLNPTMSGWREIGIEPKGILNAADTFDYLDGAYQPELSCDLAFVGGYWGYKARNLDRFIVPLCHPSKNLSVKIFGNQKWPVPQYLGLIDTHLVEDLFVSAKVCPNVSEPHSTDLGFDTIERVFKVPSSGGCLVSDYVEELDEIFGKNFLATAKTPADFEELIRHYMNSDGERESYIRKTQDAVLSKHTYWHRVSQMLGYLGMADEAKKSLAIWKGMNRGT